MGLAPSWTPPCGHGWLHGAIARGLRSEIDVAFQPMKTRFPKHSDFIFDDPTRKLDSPARRIFDGVLDDAGEAKVNTEISTDGTPPGMLRATFTTRVFEASGQSSSDRHTLPFSPYPRYIGVKMPKGDRARGMLLTDVEHPVQIVALDAKGPAGRHRRRGSHLQDQLALVVGEG